MRRRTVINEKEPAPRLRVDAAQRRSIPPKSSPSVVQTQRATDACVDGLRSARLDMRLARAAPKPSARDAATTISDAAAAAAAMLSPDDFTSLVGGAPDDVAALEAKATTERQKL